MLYGVLFNCRLLTGFVELAPDLHGCAAFAGMLGHGGSHYFHPAHRARDLGPFLEGKLRCLIVFAVEVMDIAESEIQPPVIGVLANSFFHHLRGLVRLARAGGRRLAKQSRRKRVKREPVWIPES